MMIKRDASTAWNALGSEDPAMCLPSAAAAECTNIPAVKSKVRTISIQARKNLGNFSNRKQRNSMCGGPGPNSVSLLLKNKSADLIYPMALTRRTDKTNGNGQHKTDGQHKTNERQQTNR